MDCALCSQRIAKDKGHDFFGDVLCRNCHARLKVGAYDAESMQDSFLPVLVPEGEQRDLIGTLSLRAGHVGRRGSRRSMASFLLVLYEKYREGHVDPGYVTALTLAARTLALYGTDDGKEMTDSEMRYLLTVCEQEASMLETEWAGHGDGQSRRFQVLRAFMGAILRADPSAQEIIGRILTYERVERGG